VAVDKQHHPIDHLRRQRREPRVTRGGIGGGRRGAAGKRLHPQEEPRRVVRQPQREAATAVHA
jgi:hypothetical protein